MLAPNTDVQSVLQLGGGTGLLAFLRRWLIWLIVAVVIVAGAAFWWMSGSGSPALVYTTQPVKRGDLTVSVTATGTVEPINQVDVGSEISGTIKSVNVDFNDHVTEGEVLAVIDTDKLTAAANHSRAALDAAHANVVVAQSTADQAKQDLGRIQPLAKSSFATQQDLAAAQATYDRAVASLNAANAQVKLSEADVASNESDLAHATITSPINGIVLNRNIDPGQTVAASLQAPVLFTIAEDLAQMNILVNVDEADAGAVQAGQDAAFTVEAFPDKNFAGKVEQLRYNPETVNGVVTYTAVLSADNKTLELRPGMTATADIVVKQTKDALLVPNAALRYAPAGATAAGGRGGRSLFSRIFPTPQSENRPPRTQTALAANQKRIYVLRQGELRPVPVVITTGDTDGTNTAVVSGDLQEGDAVITDASPAR